MDVNLKALLNRGLTSQFSQFPKANLIYLVNSRLRANQLIGDPLAAVIRNNSGKFITNLNQSTMKDNVVFYFDIDVARMERPLEDLMKELGDKILESSAGRYNYQGIVLSVGTSNTNFSVPEPMSAGLRMLAGLRAADLEHLAMDVSGYYIDPSMKFEPGEYQPSHLFCLKLKDYSEADPAEETFFGDFLNLSGLAPDLDDGVRFAEEQETRQPPNSMPPAAVPPSAATQAASIPPSPSAPPAGVLPAAASPQAVAAEVDTMAPVIEAMREMGMELALGLALLKQKPALDNIQGLRFLAFDMRVGNELYRGAIGNVEGELCFAFQQAQGEPQGPSLVIGGATTYVIDLGESTEVEWDELDLLSCTMPHPQRVLASFARALAMPSNSDPLTIQALGATTVSERIDRVRQVLNL